MILLIEISFSLLNVDRLRRIIYIYIHFGLERKMVGEMSNEIYSRGYFFQARLSTVDNGFAKDGRHNNVQSLLSRRHFHF